MVVLMTKLTDNQAADQLHALGNATRLRLFRLLVRAGCDGLNIGDAQRLMGLPASTLAHHMTALVRAGLVDQVRRGREVISTARFAIIQQLGAYLMQECCQGVDTEQAAEKFSAV
jgi:ArsR family transcriptional regulator